MHDILAPAAWVIPSILKCMKDKLRDYLTAFQQKFVVFFGIVVEQILLKQRPSRIRNHHHSHQVGKQVRHGDRGNHSILDIFIQKTVERVGIETTAANGTCQLIGVT